MGTLAELRKGGLIGHIGLSNVTPGQLRAALQITEIAAVTAYFNVAARQHAALLKAAVSAGAIFCPWQPVSLIPLSPSPPGTRRSQGRVRNPPLD